MMKFRKLYRGGGYKSLDDRFLIWPRLDRGYKAIDMKGTNVNSNARNFMEAREWCEKIVFEEDCKVVDARIAEMVNDQGQDQLSA